MKRRRAIGEDDATAVNTDAGQERKSKAHGETETKRKNTASLAVPEARPRAVLENHELFHVDREQAVALHDLASAVAPVLWHRFRHCHAQTLGCLIEITGRVLALLLPEPDRKKPPPLPPDGWPPAPALAMLLTTDTGPTTTQGSVEEVPLTRCVPLPGLATHVDEWTDADDHVSWFESDDHDSNEGAAVVLTQRAHARQDAWRKCHEGLLNQLASVSRDMRLASELEYAKIALTRFFVTRPVDATYGHLAVMRHCVPWPRAWMADTPRLADQFCIEYSNDHGSLMYNDTTPMSWRMAVLFLRLLLALGVVQQQAQSPYRVIDRVLQSERHERQVKALAERFDWTMRRPRVMLHHYGQVKRLLNADAGDRGAVEPRLKELWVHVCDKALYPGGRGCPGC